MGEAQFIATLFRYKASANEGMLRAMRLFDEDNHAAERRTAIYLLNHTYIVDRIFTGHLSGHAHGYLATTADETPTLDALSAAIQASDEWYVSYVAGLGRDALMESIDFIFTDGAPGRMSRAEMLAHVLMHGGCHRGAIGRIMNQLSIPLPGDVLTGYLHKAEAVQRRRAV